MWIFGLHIVIYFSILSQFDNFFNFFRFRFKMRYHFVHDDSQGVYIYFVRVVGVFLFWSIIERSADSHGINFLMLFFIMNFFKTFLMNILMDIFLSIQQIKVTIRNCGQSKISNFNLPFINEDITGFEISMNYSLLMKVNNSLQNLIKNEKSHFRVYFEFMVK